MNPVLTEKTIKLYQDFRVCTFEVSLKDNKSSLRYAFYKKYGIRPISVNIINRLGKFKRDKKNLRKGRIVGSKKIALFKIDKNKSLNLFEVK
ncbi:50S ribosomal protein L23 [Candidatus Dojkabacteria bacterium]|uniref:50S ribosomal protein L23 n=1 Tax=Candidatus Dojkabacteria bacterium TaxID=2099670 RepID=A0A3M0Z073_9BACT|nr:MAG: 50S ribosomal protein L23 [Candidatus Dojkabacteria bacterium]